MARSICSRSAALIVLTATLYLPAVADEESAVIRLSEPVEITWHEHSVTREDRESLNGHKGCVLWFTGLSGCGKRKGFAKRMRYVMLAVGVLVLLVVGAALWLDEGEVVQLRTADL